MANVISFCLWGNKPQYTQGALKNIELAKQIYPDWKCWFYFNEDEYYGSTDRNLKRQLLSGFEGGNSFTHTSSLKDHHLMMARFTAIDEKSNNTHFNADVMLVRDADSRLCKREKEAVDVWMASDKKFLVLKDHPWHAGVPILGGLWGIKKGLIPSMRRLVSDFIAKDPRNEWQCDQRFLAEKIWPLVQSEAMVFDPFYGGLNYPSPRQGDEFCGATHDENDVVPAEQIRMLQNYWRP